MEKHSAIPEGYMRIGELAKKAGINTNTLRYYGKEGLLIPSAESEGGYRLYSDKDLAKLAWILLMKQLGLGLGEIKKRLTSLDTPSDVVNMLTDHATHLYTKVAELSASISEIEALKAEINQMETTDFNKIAGVLMALQMGDANYQMIKHFDNDVMETISKKMNKSEAILMSEIMSNLFNKAAKLQSKNISPESEESQIFAKEFWEKIWEATGGDVELIQKINAQVEKIIATHKNCDEVFAATHNFVQQALQIFFSKMQEGIVT